MGVLGGSSFLSWLITGDVGGDTGLLQDLLPPQWLFRLKVTKPGARPMGNASGSRAEMCRAALCARIQPSWQ